jgi:hypothetical protein
VAAEFRGHDYAIPVIFHSTAIGCSLSAAYLSFEINDLQDPACL